MIVEDIWGTFEVESEFLKIITSKEFISLKNKSQLGLNTNPNAIHTRYQHSLGVYFLACKLINICKKKFSGILNITKEDEDAIKCMALVHDIGHGAFSHVSENFLEGTHEERTIALLQEEKSEIHQAIVNTFGENVLNKVIDLIEIKEKKETYTDSVDLMFIMRKLLTGGIDIDRIDYIYRDSKELYGKGFDFSSILETIDLEYIDDGLEIVFDGSVEYTIANFFNKRFELYDTIYLSNETRVLERVFGKFVDNTRIKLEWDTTEIKLKHYFEELANRPDSPDYIKRDANLLLNKSLDSNFVYKEINNGNTYSLFRERLISSVPELQDIPNSILESFCKVNVYSEKNKVYIRKNGLVQDLSKCSQILNSELKKEKYIIAIDLLALRRELKRIGINEIDIAKKIKKIKEAMSVEVEQEKKFIFNNLSTNPKSDFESIKAFMNLDDSNFFHNNDTYYDFEGVLGKNKINVRYRSNDTWTVKKPLTDKSSICKRFEKNFSNIESIITFLQKEWNIDIKYLDEEVTLNTKRTKYNLTYYKGVFELVFDETIPEKNGETFSPNYMIEVELKSGSSAGLYFITKALLQFPFIEECNLSKKEIALKTIKRENNKSRVRVKEQ